jgi:glycosyltransferase involved in cell wall biosynthesis
MRILIDARPLMDDRRGGVGVYTERMVRALLDAPTHRYTLFTNSFGRPMRPDGIPARAEVRSSRLPNKALNAALALVEMPGMERLARTDADAVWLPNLNFAAARAPMVVTVHDLSFERHPEFFSAKQRLWHAMVRPRDLLRRAAAITAVSEHTKSDIIATYGVDPGKIHVVAPGVGREYSPAARADLPRIRGKYALPERYLLALGTIEPRKNAVGLIKAFERMKTDADLVFAGGNGWLNSGIFKQAAASPLRDRIRFIGYVPEEDKPPLYAGAAAFAYPSFYEGFGLPVAEAMACGTPVVASTATSLAETVGDAGILVNPRDANDIALGLEAALEPSMAAVLSARGIVRAGRFDWNASARKLEALFTRLGARAATR